MRSFRGFRETYSIFKAVTVNYTGREYNRRHFLHFYDLTNGLSGRIALLFRGSDCRSITDEFETILQSKNCLTVRSQCTITDCGVSLRRLVYGLCEVLKIVEFDLKLVLATPSPYPNRVLQFSVF